MDFLPKFKSYSPERICSRKLVVPSFSYCSDSAVQPINVLLTSEGVFISSFLHSFISYLDKGQEWMLKQFHASSHSPMPVPTRALQVPSFQKDLQHKQLAQ